MPESSAILKEIKDNFDFARTYWDPIYRLGDKDVRYLVNGPWDKADLDARAGRVTLSLDELSQYTNQIKNEFRQSKRAVKVKPKGNGANDETAMMRAGLIRGIEYESRAQQAYVCAGENMVDRGFGCFKLITEYKKGSSNRCIKIRRIANPRVIYLDPDAKEADWSDGEWGFEFEKMRESVFVARFGKKVQIQSFTEEHIASAPMWISSGDGGKHVQVASYWKREAVPNPIYLLETGRDITNRDNPEFIAMPESPTGNGVKLDGQAYAILDEHDDNDYKVVQYVSNGVEVIETNPTDWKEVPLIPMFGPEMWVPNEAGTSERVFMSAVRRALEAYKGYCYVKSGAVERAAMDPKTPYEGYEGQFDTKTDFTTINKNLQGYVEFKPKTTAGGEVVLPMPQRPMSEPMIQQHELLAESLRRSIQAAMGSSPLPTSAQRQNQKSGVALDKIEQSTDQGNFHFTDSYAMALERAGRMMDDALDVVYDTPREEPFYNESDEASTLPINQLHPETGQPVGFHTSTGDHGVTISTGPSQQSQRDEATDFTNQLIAHPEVLGPNAPKIIALLVKLKALGPIGDQIAKILDPQDTNVPPEIAQQIQAAQRTIQQLQVELQAAKAGDAIKKYTVDEQEKTKRVLGLVKVDQQDAETRLDQMLGSIGERFDKLHERHTQLLDQQHERDQSEAERQHQAEITASGREHETQMAAQAAQGESQ